MNKSHNSYPGKYFFVAIFLGILLFRANSIYSRVLSNYTAMYLPNIWETNILQARTITALQDYVQVIRSSALKIDPLNQSAKFQEFRWERAKGDLYEAATYVPLAEQYDFVQLAPDYSLIKATYYSLTALWDEAISYYQLSMSQNKDMISELEQEDYYHALAQNILVNDHNNFDSRYTAGKYFQLSNNFDDATDQAKKIILSGEQNKFALSWAYYLLSQKVYNKNDINLAIHYLNLALEQDKNPAAASMLLSIAQDLGDENLEATLKVHLLAMEPDWKLSDDNIICIDEWILSGFDIDKDILNAGVHGMLNFYWFPKCNEVAFEYGLIDTGKYWLQLNYLQQQVLINPSFEWELPEKYKTMNGSTIDCCEIAIAPFKNQNKALVIQWHQFPATVAASQFVYRHVEPDQLYLVGGMIRWGEVEIDKEVTAVIGGFWLDENYEKLVGFNTDVDMLQNFFATKYAIGILPLNSGWSQWVAIVKSPPKTRFFSPWLGLTSASGGSAEVYLDDLFMLPIFVPEKLRYVE